MKRLIDIGFCRAGQWVLDGKQKLQFKLDEGLPESAALYAFVTGRTVRYVGKTVRSLKERMQNYRNSDRSQRTNILVNGEIKSLLGQCKAVDIYALFDPGFLRYGPFPLNLPAALEDSIIAALKPEWNKSGA
jgi:hypothetical protein